MTTCFSIHKARGRGGKSPPPARLGRGEIPRKLTQTLDELKKTHAYNQWIVETVRLPLLILNARLHVVSANRAFYKAFQISKEETENRAIYSLKNGQWNFPVLHELFEKILPKNIEVNDFQIEHNSPVLGRRIMLLNARRLGRQNLIFLAIEDITERKTSEQQIQALNASLEQKIAGRTHELTVLNQELESFCHSVAHDLRTPLRSIVSFSQIIEKKWKEEMPTEAGAYLRYTVDAAKHMTRLIDHLLDLSRVTRREMKREKMDLTSEVHAISDELKRCDSDRCVDFRIESGLAANGDPWLLRLVLQNLLENAWKFTHKTPHASIHFGKIYQDGREVFFLRDNGIGFDMAYANKLFGLFQRLHDEKEFSGAGIGLVTAQRIIQRHEGKIWVNAAVNRGATFYFTLKEDFKQEALL